MNLINNNQSIVKFCTKATNNFLIQNNFDIFNLSLEDFKTEEKPKFIQSKMFLGIVTAFAIVMLAFPYYSSIFYPKTEKQIIVVDKSNIQKVEFTISGMTCASCGEHVNHEVNKLTGIISSNASYENGNAIVEFDNSKTHISEIEKAINSTGYSVTDKK